MGAKQSKIGTCAPWKAGSVGHSFPRLAAAQPLHCGEGGGALPGSQPYFCLQDAFVKLHYCQVLISAVTSSFGASVLDSASQLQLEPQDNQSGLSPQPSFRQNSHINFAQAGTAQMVKETGK